MEVADGGQSPPAGDRGPRPSEDVVDATADATDPDPGANATVSAVLWRDAAAKARKGAQRTPTTHKLRKDGPRRPVGPKKPSGRR